MAKLHTPRWAWVLTGSGHFFTESFALIHELEHCDIFVSKAANEVLRMYKLKLDFPDTMRVLHDKTASSVPVGGFYHGVYHTVVVAPASSNTVAKCVLGHFRHARHQRLCPGGQMPRAGDRLCLRHRARTRNHGAARPGQGLSAPDRPGKYRTAEELRADQGGRIARRPGGRDPPAPGRTRRSDG